MQKINIKINIVDDQIRRPLRKSSLDLDVLDWLRVWDASEVYFDGERHLGYGGYSYDGRWKKVVDKLIKNYGLTAESSLLDVGCAKGYLVHDFNLNSLVGTAVGVDISAYALICGSREKMHGRLVCSNAINIPFADNSFDIVFCKDTLHNLLTEDEVVKALSELQRVAKKAWVRVGAYNTIEQKKMIDKWATFATCYFHTDKWIELFKKAGYQGDFDWFHPSDIIS